MAYKYLILHYLSFVVVVIDLIYIPDIFDINFGSRTIKPILEALLSSLGLAQSCWVVGQSPESAISHGLNQAGYSHLMHVSSVQCLQQDLCMLFTLLAITMTEKTAEQQVNYNGGHHILGGQGEAACSANWPGTIYFSWSRI